MTGARLLEGARESATLFSSCAKAADELWIATAWASEASSVAGELWRARRCITSLVVGLDFHQTDPKFLRRFRTWARVFESADGTFHPKVYLFRHGDRFDAIVGSSNLTAGGFGANLEANVHLTGATRDPVFLSLVSFVEELGRGGRQMFEREIDHYEGEWRKRRRDVERLRRVKPAPKSSGRAGGVQSALALHVDWRTFARSLPRAVATRAAGGYFWRRSASVPGYIGVISEAQDLFARRKKLARMSVQDRLKVGGLVEPYGYFGRMTGAGRFNHYMRAEPERLDRALDHVPLKPVLVTEAHFRAFVAAITKTKGLGRPGVGSRLLAMKRPDVFLCLDSANRIGLSKSFGLPPGRLNTYDGYWELIALLRSCPWYSAPKPRGRDRLIWEARVALVDALFYEPT